MVGRGDEAGRGAGTGWPHLGESFSRIPFETCVVVGHPSLGFAAISEANDPEAISRVASVVTAMLGGIPGGYRCVPVQGKTPNGIMVAMAEAARSMPAPDRGMYDVTLALLSDPTESSPARSDDAGARRSALGEDTARLLEAFVLRTLDGRRATLAGLEIPQEYVAAAQALLPALLVTAAERWAFPVVASGGKGGFVVDLARDPAALLGYAVRGIEASAPLLLLLPVAHVLRRLFVEDECMLDPIVSTFSWYLDRVKGDQTATNEVDLRVEVLS